MARHHDDSPEALRAKADKEAQAATDAMKEKDVKVGEPTSTPADKDHAAVAPGTPADAKAPLTAEHLAAPEDVYKQNPPPLMSGPAAAKEPPLVVLPPGQPPAVDPRGYPVEAPKHPGYQDGTAPPDAE